MISYETYKILHLFTLFMLISSIGVVIGEGRWIPNRTFKIVVGVLSFLAFVAGMGLIARLGFKHTEPFPAWIWVKMIAWVTLNAIIIGVFKYQSKQAKFPLTVAAIAVILAAVIAAVTKLA